MGSVVERVVVDTGVALVVMVEDDAGGDAGGDGGVDAGGDAVDAGVDAGG